MQSSGFFLTGIMKGFNQQKHEMFHLIGIHEEFCSHLGFFLTGILKGFNRQNKKCSI